MGTTKDNDNKKSGQRMLFLKCIHRFDETIIEPSNNM